jgi:hypothetical protein
LKLSRCVDDKESKSPGKVRTRVVGEATEHEGKVVVVTVVDVDV